MMRRRVLVAGTACATVIALSACGTQPLNDVALPGTKGFGGGSYSVTVELTNAAGLVPNNPVKADQVTIGTLTDLRVDGWHAEATVRLARDVRLPANTEVKVGQTSLLGSKYLELGPPAGRPARGRLAAGDTLPLGRSSTYPKTEDVLAGVATLLNGGGLAQLRTIVGELNNAFSGRTGRIRNSLTQLERFVTGLDAQRSQIIGAIEGVDRVSGRLANQNEVLDEILRDLPPALEVLNRQRSDLVQALDQVGTLGRVANDVIPRIEGDLERNLANLTPVLRETADAGSSVVQALWLLPTLLFPMKTLHEAVNGDYADLFATVDLTFGTLDEAFLTGTPLEGRLGQLAQGLANGQAGVPGELGGLLTSRFGAQQGIPEARGRSGTAEPEAEQREQSSAEPRPNAGSAPSGSASPSSRDRTEQDAADESGNLLGPLLGRGGNS